MISLYMSNECEREMDKGVSDMTSKDERRRKRNKKTLNFFSFYFCFLKFVYFVLADRRKWLRVILCASSLIQCLGVGGFQKPGADAMANNMTRKGETSNLAGKEVFEKTKNIIYLI